MGTQNQLFVYEGSSLNPSHPCMNMALAGSQLRQSPTTAVCRTPPKTQLITLLCIGGPLEVPVVQAKSIGASEC